MDSIDDIYVDRSIHSLRELLNQVITEIDQESATLNDYKNKPFRIKLINGELVEGFLSKVEKYRIAIEMDEKVWWYYKRSIIGYSGDI